MVLLVLGFTFQMGTLLAGAMIRLLMRKLFTEVQG